MPSVDYAVTSKYFQSSDESCWYAAYCTLFDYKQQPIGQIRERIDKAQPKLDYKDYWNNGLPDEKYNEVRWCLGLSGYRRAYFSQLVDDLDYLGKLMKDYGPFWVAFSVPSEHAVANGGSARKTFGPRRRCLYPEMSGCAAGSRFRGSGWLTTLRLSAG